LEKEKETPEFIKKKQIIEDEEAEEVEVEEAPGDNNDDCLFASDW
jgi:hypothetical protein